MDCGKRVMIKIKISKINWINSEWKWKTIIFFNKIDTYTTTSIIYDFSQKFAIYKTVNFKLNLLKYIYNIQIRITNPLPPNSYN